MRLAAEEQQRMQTGAGGFVADTVAHAEALAGRGEVEAALHLLDELRKTHSLHSIAWLNAAKLLRAARRTAEAETLLEDAVRRFPGNPSLAIERATLAREGGKSALAVRCHEEMRARFPDRLEGFVEGATALRELARFDEAEAVVADARRRFPDAFEPLVELAWIAQARKDWPLALRRWEDVRARQPAHPVGYGWAAHALCMLGRVAEAEAMLREVAAAQPNDSNPPIALARVAELAGNWEQAGHRWHEVTTRFPLLPEGPIGEATALRRLGHAAAADAVIEAAIARLPDNVALTDHYALNAMAREDFALALTRVEAALRRFPASNGLRQRLFEVQLRIADAGGAPAPAPAAPVAGSDGDRDRELVMHFESLGGAGHGCEFGIFQRSLGAEPLGLLRWADLWQDRLTAALENEFAGVGEPEFTQIYVPENQPPRGEYWTRDTRFHMGMRSFVHVDEVPPERMARLVRLRLRFLREKLIEDLRAGNKIFVFKNLKANLSDADLVRLHRAVRRYGDNTLFYVRYQDGDHPNGTVDFGGPGLLIGYIDHFSHAPDTDARLGPAHGQWLALCRKAFALWSSGQTQGAPLSTAAA